MIIERSRRRRRHQPSISPESNEPNQRNQDREDRDDGGFGDDGPYAYEGLSHGTLKLIRKFKNKPICLWYMTPRYVSLNWSQVLT